jgi:DICT domain-containing protein
MRDLLTTAQLAERTGVRAATLRMWEVRYGFPDPAGGESGQRRYDSRTADLVREVVRLREQGLSLPAAIAGVRAANETAPASVFAGLRERRPELAPVVLTKSALLVLTRAIEDEYCAQASAGALFASFQRARFYRQVQRRWRELARTAGLAVAMADFDRVRTPQRSPAEVPVPRRHPLSREWTVVVDAPGARACVSAWERPSAVDLPDELRPFEVLWSAEPEIVVAAAATACHLIATFAPELACELPDYATGPLVATSAELRFASALTRRIVGYLGEELSRGNRTPEP